MANKHIKIFTLLYYYTDTRFLLLQTVHLEYHQQAFEPFLHPQIAPNSAFLKKLILRKITKITATKCRILKLKCTKFLQRSTRPFSYIWGGLLLRGGYKREGRKGKGRRRGEGRWSWESLLHESKRIDAPACRAAIVRTCYTVSK